MSEAVNPNQNAESLQSGESNPAVVSSSEPGPVAAAADSEDDWQTVDFPGAIPLQELVEGASPVEASAAVMTTSNQAQETAPACSSAPDPESLQNLVAYLRRENSSLRGQVVQLEQDIAQVQVELQLEVARFYCKESEHSELSDGANPIAMGEGVELVSAQTPIQRLSQDLEQSHQTVQQQQHLINTLMEQVESGQERIAQLERDCALSQQRYTEQGQQVIQLENTCNDLRMRLHRQQQQTLQFKAALEKSLEMSPAITADYIGSNDTIIHFPIPEPAEAQAFIPKAQPVQPWSIATEASAARSHVAPPKSQAKELPNLLKLFHTDTPDHSQPSDVLASDVMGSEAASIDLTSPPPELIALANSAIPAEVPAPATSAETTDLDALFPDLPPIAIAPDAPAQDAIFDLSPFLEAGEVDPAAIPAVRATATPSDPIAAVSMPAESEAELPADPLQGTNLWADLARLIEPEMVTENAAIAPDLTIEAEAPSVTVAAIHRVEAIEMNQQILPETKSAEMAAMMSDASFANPFAEAQPSLAQPSFETPWIAEMSPGSPFITVKSPTAVKTAPQNPFPEPAIPTVNSLDPSPAEDPAGLPSPVLNPFRPAKKIKSMAAVELPSFPRTAQSG
jgi:hypothetical protein